MHAERNALDNCSDKPIDGTIYITGKPCPTCLLGIIQKGLKKIVYLDREGTRLEPYDALYLEKLTNMHKIEVIIKNLDVEWIKNCVS